MSGIQGSGVTGQSDNSYIIVLADGRFVQRIDKGRTFCREYPDATKFTKGRAATEAAQLTAAGQPCRAISEKDYASC